jgi:CubicO group peptidase (beta-lactamase class C family)
MSKRPKSLSASRRVAVCAAVVLAVCQQVALAQNGGVKNGKEHTAQIQEVLSAAYKYRVFNGSALVAEHGKIIYKSAFGMANMGRSVPNAPATRFRLGSITKQFTSMLALQLVEQGKIKLDAKISDYLPDYRKDIGEKVTIHHLLTHTSGIPSYTGLPGFFENVSRNPYKVADFVTKYTSGDLEFEPGSKFSYNNSGYFLLGAIIEKVTGKSYEQVLKENILDPVGMKNTGYDWHSPLIPKRAAGYTKTADGYTNAAYLDMSIPYAAGSMYSTVEDLYLWDQALYTDKLISPQTKELMFKPFLDDYAYGWNVSNASFKLNDQPVQMIRHGGGINGFSTMIARFPKEKNLIVILDNTAQNTGRLSETITKILYNQPYELPKMSIIPLLEKTFNEQGLEAAIAQYRELKAKHAATYDFSENELNRFAFMVSQTGKIKEAIALLKLNLESYPKNANALEMLKRFEATPVAVDAKVFDTYVGEYELSPGFILRVYREGEKFMTQATNQNPIEVFAESDTVFYPKVMPAKLTFLKDADGKVTAVRLNQGGREIVGKKIK